MTSIRLELAKEIIKNNGEYCDDPIVVAVIRYSAFDKFNFKVVYSILELMHNMDSFNRRFMLPKVIWKLGQNLTMKQVNAKIKALPTNKDMKYPYEV